MMYGTSVWSLEQSSSAWGVLVDVIGWSDHAWRTVHKPDAAYACSASRGWCQLWGQQLQQWAWSIQQFCNEGRAVVGDVRGTPLYPHNPCEDCEDCEDLWYHCIFLRTPSHPFAPLCIHSHQPLPIQYVPYVVICCHPIDCSLPILLHSIPMLFHILFHILDTFHILAYLSTRPLLGESLEFSLQISLARYACLCCIIFHLITLDFPCKYLSFSARS